MPLILRQLCIKLCNNKIRDKHATSVQPDLAKYHFSSEEKWQEMVLGENWLHTSICLAYSNRVVIIYKPYEKEIPVIGSAVLCDIYI